MEDKRKELEEALHRVVAFLDRHEVDFLDKLGSDALFTTGHKLARTQIIKEIVDLLMESSIDAKGVHTPEEFKEKMKQAISQGLVEEKRE